MLKKLRLKFVCITMVIVTVMLCVILGLVLNTTAQSLEQQNLEALHSAASGPPDQPPLGEHPSTPHFILQRVVTGVIIIKGEEYFDLSDQTYLQTIYNLAAEAPENTGILWEYALRYYRTAGVRGEQILYADISSQIKTMENLILSCVFIGVAAFFIFLAISFWLAKWAIRPVEIAWAEQRQFVADASHELKTPLTVILTNAELLSQEQEESRRQQFIGHIHTVSQQMRNLVEGLLELARVDNGAVKQAFEPVELTQLTRDTALPFEAVFFEAGLTLELQLTPGITVMGSSAHLRQVLEILLDNAGKYSAPASQVLLRLEKEGSRDCRLLVSTAGESISQEDLENIFRRFYRVDKARTSGSGYGLGLPIAKAIVEDHGGRIWATSEQGINTFHIKLPTA